jgi:hypothetical protein
MIVISSMVSPALGWRAASAQVPGYPETPYANHSPA